MTTFLTISCTRSCLKRWVWKEEAYGHMNVQKDNHPSIGIRRADDISGKMEGRLNSKFRIIRHPLQEHLQLHFGKTLLIATLDVVASLMHLKLKYHNLTGEPITINSNLKGETRIYEALQRDQGTS